MSTCFFAGFLTGFFVGFAVGFGVGLLVGSGVGVSSIAGGVAVTAPPVTTDKSKQLVSDIFYYQQIHKSCL